eukprot:1261228-Karenia_brevis.AAC.1
MEHPAIPVWARTEECDCPPDSDPSLLHVFTSGQEAYALADGASAKFEQSRPVSSSFLPMLRWPYPQSTDRKVRQWVEYSPGKTILPSFMLFYG